jgi:hypothetical protein
MFFEQSHSANGAFCELGLLGGHARILRLGAPRAANSGVSAMISLLPEDAIRSAVQMACYGFAAFTAFVAFMFTPRW